MEQGAIDALLFFLSPAGDERRSYGNPSSIHWAGRQVKGALDDARETIALSLGLSDPNSLCFTGSATEATNMALKGCFFQEKTERTVHIFLSTVEHEATLETARFLEGQGAILHWIPVNAQGALDLVQLETELAATATDKKNFLLVSLMAANNETGVIFPVAAVGELCLRFGALFHVDAAQAWGKVPGFRIDENRVQLASLSAHKIGGPKGVGALFVKKGVKLQPLLHGGAQERKRRAGTVNVGGIASFAAAAKALEKRDLVTIKLYRDGLEAAVKQIPGAHILGTTQPRLVNTTNVLFDGVRGEGLIMGLDLAGFAVSAGSACNSGSINPSHVLLAMGWDKAAAASAVRISLGPSTTLDEIRSFTEALAVVITRIRTRSQLDLPSPRV